jgi:hypothetical protein
VPTITSHELIPWLHELSQLELAWMAARARNRTHRELAREILNARMLDLEKDAVFR